MNHKNEATGQSEGVWNSEVSAKCLAVIEQYSRRPKLQRRRDTWITQTIPTDETEAAEPPGKTIESYIAMLDDWDREWTLSDTDEPRDAGNVKHTPVRSETGGKRNRRQSTTLKSHKKSISTREVESAGDWFITYSRNRLCIPAPRQRMYQIHPRFFAAFLEEHHLTTGPPGSLLTDLAEFGYLHVFSMLPCPVRPYWLPYGIASHQIHCNMRPYIRWSFLTRTRQLRIVDIPQSDHREKNDEFDVGRIWNPPTSSTICARLLIRMLQFPTWLHSLTN
jgi:hypothetical protein